MNKSISSIILIDKNDDIDVISHIFNHTIQNMLHSSTTFIDTKADKKKVIIRHTKVICSHIYNLFNILIIYHINQSIKAKQISLDKINSM